MSETTRRAVLAGAAGVTAASVLAACGDGDSGSKDTTANNAAGGPLAKKSDIPVGGGKIVSDGGGVVITQPEAGTYKAFTAICTHQQCVVSEVANNTINCRCHGSTFSAADGSATNPPATQPLAEKKLRFEGEEIFLQS